MRSLLKSTCHNFLNFLHKYEYDIVVTVNILMTSIAMIMACLAVKTVCEYYWGTAPTASQDDVELLQPLPKRGLTKRELKALPMTSYEKVPDVEAECAICLTEFKERERIRKLQCGHEFHIKCVDMWLRIRSLCPSCRREVVAVPCSKKGNKKGSLINN